MWSSWQPCPLHNNQDPLEVARVRKNAKSAIFNTPLLTGTDKLCALFRWIKGQTDNFSPRGEVLPHGTNFAPAGTTLTLESTAGPSKEWASGGVVWDWTPPGCSSNLCFVPRGELHFYQIKGIRKGQIQVVSPVCCANWWPHLKNW
jgi:hypothetical protein